MEKPVVALAPVSHWNWVVSPEAFVKSLYFIHLSLVLTGDDAATAFTVSDSTARVDAEVCSGQTVVTNTNLAITELTKRSGDTARGSQVEAAAIAATNKGISAGSEGCDGDEALHYASRMQGKRGL